MVVDPDIRTTASSSFYSGFPRLWPAMSGCPDVRIKGQISREGIDELFQLIALRRMIRALRGVDRIRENLISLQKIGVGVA
jgi:hypothetical protein